MTRVKICGLTTFEDARHAVLSGANYLGFIFYPPSPRAVSIETAAAIARALRADAATRPRLAQPDPVLLVGVFVNEDPVTIDKTLRLCGLDLAQLSGEELPAAVTGADSPITGRAYKALRPQTGPEARTMTPAYSAPTPADAPTLLLDAYHPALRGGTGETADWHLASQLRELTPRLMLAGGLTPDSVDDAIRQVQPFAVDVASGVEMSRGRKDPVKVERFITAAQGALP